MNENLSIVFCVSAMEIFMKLNKKNRKGWQGPLSGKDALVQAWRLSLAPRSHKVGEN